VRTGAGKGRNPGPSFDGSWYLRQYPDVAASGENPLVHFIRFGAAEGRSASPAGAAARPAVAGGGPPTVRDVLRSTFAALQPLRTYFVPDVQPRLTMITDSINPPYLYGGVGTAIVLACLLADRMGAALRVVTRTDRPDPSNLKKIIDLHQTSWTGNIDFRFASYADDSAEIDVGERDLFLTTSWWTTLSTRQAVNPERMIYLLQEDERMFYPYGDDRVRCCDVLADDKIRFVINSKLLFDHFIEDGMNNVGRNGVWFEPAFPHKNYYVGTRDSKGLKNFFFYARPHNLRNLYFRGLEAIETALQRGVLVAKDWNIHFVGKDLTDVELTGGVRPILHQNLDWSDYVALVRRMDVGLSLMASPHPSYPPLDLAACGAVVVTNAHGHKTSLARYSENILCVDGSVDGLVQGIADAVALAADAPRRTANYEKSGLLRDWAASFEPVLRWLVKG
jgi:hypothetical protein